MLTFQALPHVVNGRPSHVYAQYQRVEPVMAPNPVVSARVDPDTYEQIEKYAGERDRATAVTELLETGLDAKSGAEAADEVGADA